MHKKFRSQGFTIVSISLDKEADRAKYKQFVKENEMDWLHVMDGKFWKAELAQKYEVHGIPAVFLIDPKGKCIADSETLNIHDEAAFSKAVADALKKTPPTVKGALVSGKAQKELADAEKLLAKKDYYKAMKAFERIALKHKSDDLGKTAAARIKQMKADKKIVAVIAKVDADKNAPKLLQLAAQLAEGGKTEGARKYYQSVIDKYPDSPYAEQARQAMEGLHE